jgi:WD40 repeat protein
LSSSYDGTAILWPVQWEGVLSTLTVPGAYLVAVHPTAPIIAVGFELPDSPSSEIWLMDMETDSVIRRLDGNREYIQSMAFSPDGRLLLSGDAATDYTTIDDQDVYVWDVETGERIAILEDHHGWINAIAFSPDGRTVAIGEGTGARITFWDLETFTSPRVLEGHRDWVTGLRFSPDGRFLYSGARDGEVFQWDVESGEVIRTYARHVGGVWGFDLSADGTRLFTAAADGPARILDTATGETLYNLEGHSDRIYNLAYNPDQNTLVTTSGDGTLIVWDAETGERLRRYFPTSGGGSLPIFAVFSADGRWLISGDIDKGQLTVMDASPLPEGLEAWVSENRYIAAFTCEQRTLYLIQPLCRVGQAEA